MTDILQKNCSFISKNNDSLTKKLNNVVSIDKNITLDTNLVGEYNLFVDGLPIHSVTGAVEEAKNIAASITHNDYGTIHIIYGLGLGYLADEFIQSLKGKVVVYEPDLEVLAFVLSAVDFSENLKSGRLFVVSDLNELQDVLCKLYRYKSNCTFSYLDYHKNQGMDFDVVCEWVKKELVLISHNFNFQVKNMYSFFNSTLKRLDKKFQLKKLTDYKDSFKDFPAIIVSAGPSLNRNIDALKNVKDKAVIFCVGTALGTLYKNGITPDFLNVIERVNTSHHYNLPFSKDISFICEQFTEPSYLDIPFKERFLTNSLENDDAKWFLEKADQEFIQFETKGTVSYHALYSAYYLGCNPIILVGQDLAYSDGSCYSKGSKFEDLECVFDNEKNEYKVVAKDLDKFKDAYYASVNWDEDKKVEKVKQRLETFNQNLVTVPGQDNNLLPTDSVYSLFINYIQDFAARHKDERKLFNASLGGALIKGFDVLSLNEIFQTIDINADKSALMSGFYAKKTNAGYDLLKVKKNLKKDFDILKKVFAIAEPALEKVKKLKETLESNPGLDSDKSKMLDNIYTLFSKIVNDYMLKNRIITMLTADTYSEIAFLKREYPKIENIDVFKLFVDAYYDYFYYSITRINKTIESLDDTLEELEKIK